MKKQDYYVYLHRRLSDNKVFYVGKGRNKRAFSRHGRNDRWVKTVEKHGLLVEIVYDSLDESEAFALEKETVLEMRYHFHSTLCNMTEGGEGVPGYKWDKSKHISSKQVGRKLTQEHKNRISEANAGRKMPEKAKIKFQQHNLSKRVFSFIRKSLENSLVVPAIFLAKVHGTNGDEFRKVPFQSFSREAIEKSANSRRGKPAHNSGKNCPELSKEKNPSADLNVYEFINKSGEVFIGTRYELSREYPSVSLSQLGKLFYSEPRKWSCGWSLNKGK